MSLPQRFPTIIPILAVLVTALINHGFAEPAPAATVVGGPPLPPNQTATANASSVAPPGGVVAPTQLPTGALANGTAVVPPGPQPASPNASQSVPPAPQQPANANTSQTVPPNMATPLNASGPGKPTQASGPANGTHGLVTLPTPTGHAAATFVVPTGHHNVTQAGLPHPTVVPRLIPGINTTTEKECMDTRSLCSYWHAKTDECQYDLTPCKGTCSAKCTIKFTTLECKDDHSNCTAWASHEECEKNPYYMIWKCPIACGWCKPGGPDHIPIPLPLLKAVAKDRKVNLVD